MLSTIAIIIIIIILVLNYYVSIISDLGFLTFSKISGYNFFQDCLCFLFI